MGAWLDIQVTTYLCIGRDLSIKLKWAERREGEYSYGNSPCTLARFLTISLKCHISEQIIAVCNKGVSNVVRGMGSMNLTIGSL